MGSEDAFLSLDQRKEPRPYGHTVYIDVRKLYCMTSTVQAHGNATHTHTTQRKTNEGRSPELKLFYEIFAPHNYAKLTDHSVRELSYNSVADTRIFPKLRNRFAGKNMQLYLALCSKGLGNFLRFQDGIRRCLPELRSEKRAYSL